MLKCEIIGNLGADAEVKEANGSKFVAMRVAHSSKWIYCRDFIQRPNGGDPWLCIL